MSGGSYDYLYCKVEEMADRIGNTPERQRFAKHLRRVAKAMHAIEWVDSCDWGKGDENAPIRAVFDPVENVALDHDAAIAEAERRMNDSYARWHRLSDQSETADDQRHIHALASEASHARVKWLGDLDEWFTRLVEAEARDAKGGAK